MTLIIGYGNPLRGDDAVGAVVAEQVSSRLGLPTLSPHQLLPEHADTIARASLVVFVDASVGGTPGAVSCGPVKPGPRPTLDHHLSPEALLRLTHDVFGCEPPAWLVRIEGQAFAFGTPLSPAVAKAVPEAVALIQKLVPAL